MAPPQQDRPGDAGDEDRGDTAPMQRIQSEALADPPGPLTVAAPENPLYSTNERTVMIVRPHIAKIGVLAIQTVIIVLAALIFDPYVGGADDILFAIALFYLARLGWQVLEYTNDRFVITDRRIFRLSGVLTRNVASMPLDKLTDLIYHRSVPGRILGYGTIVVETAGQDQALSSIDYLPQPDRVYRQISRQVFK